MGEGLYRSADGHTAYPEPFEGFEANDIHARIEALDDLGDETTLDACKGNQKWRSGRREGRGRGPFLAHKYITGKSFPPQPPYINQMTVRTPKRFSG